MQVDSQYGHHHELSPQLVGRYTKVLCDVHAVGRDNSPEPKTNQVAFDQPL